MAWHIKKKDKEFIRPQASCPSLFLLFLWVPDHGQRCMVRPTQREKEKESLRERTENMREHFLWFFLSFLDQTVSSLSFNIHCERSGPRKEKEQEKVKRCACARSMSGSSIKRHLIRNLDPDNWPRSVTAYKLLCSRRQSLHNFLTTLGRNAQRSEWRRQTLIVWAWSGQCWSRNCVGRGWALAH